MQNAPKYNDINYTIQYNALIYNSQMYAYIYKQKQKKEIIVKITDQYYKHML